MIKRLSCQEWHSGDLCFYVFITACISPSLPVLTTLFSLHSQHSGALLLFPRWLNCCTPPQLSIYICCVKAVCMWIYGGTFRLAPFICITSLPISLPNFYLLACSSLMNVSMPLPVSSPSLLHLSICHLPFLRPGRADLLSSLLSLLLGVDRDRDSGPLWPSLVPNRLLHFLCAGFDQITRHCQPHPPPFSCSNAAQAQPSNPFDYNSWDLCAVLPLQISCCIKRAQMPL